jgi:hypothetical protein
MSIFKFEQTLQGLNSELHTISNEITALGDKNDKENLKLKSNLMKKYKTVQSIVSGLMQLKMIS